MCEDLAIFARIRIREDISICRDGVNLLRKSIAHRGDQDADPVQRTSEEPVDPIAKRFGCDRISDVLKQR